ncbi:serine/threonine protein kinase [bacterium]|nr:serine/threonine protein kinase [bacterium]
MSAPSWIGRKLSGRYEIEELIGQGGMSSVYRGEDPNLRRTVAIKLIHPHLSTDPSFVSRFEEEAANIAQLRHPNIIQVYDFSHDEETYYMVMEFVPGETLETHLKRLEKTNRRMDIKDAIHYIANICDALEYAHNRGMIHRDIKPANMMLTPQKEAVLMDFGIAKIVGGKKHTATGAVVGTALYMAPEVIKGEQADKRADIYALGVTLFEILSGHPPFQADSAMSTLMMHVHDPIPDLRKLNQDVPLGLVQVVEKALAKDKAQRFQSAAEFGRALRQVGSNVDFATEVAPYPGEIYSTMVEPQSGADYRTSVEAVPAPPRTSSTMQQLSEPEWIPKAQNSSVASNKRPFRLSLPVIIVGGLIGILLLVGVFMVGGWMYKELVAAPTSTLEVIETATEATMGGVALGDPTEEILPTATIAVVVDTLVPTNTPEPTLTPTATNPPEPYVRINSISLENGVYLVDYETFGYTEVLPGEHVHFFFNTVAPEDAGVGGAGPWYVWGGPRPFNGYKTSDRPSAATQMCGLYAYPNHTIALNTGNCVDLP